MTVTPGLLEYSSGDTLDYVEPCLPCASVSVETLNPLQGTHLDCAVEDRLPSPWAAAGAMREARKACLEDHGT